MNRSEFGFQFDNTFANQMAGFYLPFDGTVFPAPQLLQLNTELAEQLALDAVALNTPAGAAALAGSAMPTGAKPIAMLYAGHQFGHFSPRLGDGRALLMGEVINTDGQRQDIHLKGSGRTAFSRGGDGKAAVGPMLREYLMGEAMHALGIPTTRALAVVSTGENIQRERVVPGAVLVRVAASHLRVGTFQYFAARDDLERVRQLADYTLRRHYPTLVQQEEPYLALLQTVVQRQASLIAQWMLVGFVHGVMNTDNMTLSGETIDYGPCAFMDTYHPATVFSSIDTHGRYAYGHQPVIGQWNLARLAETLLPFISDGEDEAIRLATEAVHAFDTTYEAIWLTGMRAKLGLSNQEPSDAALVDSLLVQLQDHAIDYTRFFRALAPAVLGNTEPLQALFQSTNVMTTWLSHWQERLQRDPLNPVERVAAMNAVNPIYIPRNHIVETALNTAMYDGNLEPFQDLLTVLKQPFHERPGLERYSQPAPSGADRHITYCGT